MNLDKYPLTQENLTKYCEEVRKELHKTYPYLKKIQKMPKRQLKTKEQLEEEALIVHKLAFASGEKYMPEKEGIRYHIVSMQWVTKWKIYVDYERICGKSIEESKGTQEDQLTAKFHHVDDG